MIPKSVLFFSHSKGGVAMLLMFLWWMFVVGCFVWVAGMVYLGVIMVKDAATGDPIAASEIFEVLIWPYELARILFIAIMIASDDRLG